MSKQLKLGTLALSVSMALATTSGYAEEATDDAATDEKVVVLGSRSAPRSVSDSPVPIDLISGDDFVNNPAGNLLDAVSNNVPSFNVNTQPISDAATMVRPANMRGLPPDNTLVLVNGKRRHRSAVISFLGAGLSDGSQGPDISVIPGLALSQVEVLRDGAAAQYGSDAIAGVMNFVLKDDNSGGVVQVRMGQYSEGDGDSVHIAGNFGVPLTENGFANITYQFKESDATSRSVQRFDAENLIAAGNSAVANPAQIWGSPEITDDISIFGNFGIDLGSDGQAYMFANYSSRHVEGGFFFRNPTNRGGVFDGPTLDDEFYSNSGSIYSAGDNVDTILVGDLTAGATDNSNCPIVRLDADGIPNSAALGSLDAANCWAFNLMFPGGFTPRFGGDVIDTAITAGFNGYFGNGISYDFSASVGRSQADFMIFNTVNASLGPKTPTTFKPGTYIELDKSVNADFTQEVQVDGWDYPLQLAYGYEYKNDSFQIIAGDLASFDQGPLYLQGFGVGSNGFGGFQPAAAGTNSRHNHAVYFDIEAQVTDDWLIGGAIRTEDYSDFGSTLDGKLTTQVGIMDGFSFRGSVSTGFRAPTAGQQNVMNVTTALNASGGLADEATLPPTHPASQYFGAVALSPEESEAVSFGFVYERNDLFATIDFYKIDIDDRIGTSQQFELDSDDQTYLDAQGVANVLSLTSLRYFTNAFSTSTEGIDLVVNYSMDHMGGTTDLSYIANYTMTEVTDRDPDVINNTRVFQLEDTLPKYRNSLSATHKQDNWSIIGRLNYYGTYTETHLDDIGLLIDNDAVFTLDAAVNYNISSEFTVTVGAQNLTDEYPERNPYGYTNPYGWNGGSGWGAKYSLTSPMGFNGAYYYAEATYNY